MHNIIKIYACANRTLRQLSILLDLYITSLFFYILQKLCHQDWNSKNTILPVLLFLEIFLL